MIADFYNVPISNVKKLVLNFFDKGKYVLQYENLQLYLRLGLKLKNIQRALEFNQSKNKSRKTQDKDDKALYKLINNVVSGKTVGNLRNRIDIKRASNKLVRMFKMGIKTNLYITQSI